MTIANLTRLYKNNNPTRADEKKLNKVPDIYTADYLSEINPYCELNEIKDDIIVSVPTCVVRIIDYVTDRNLHEDDAKKLLAENGLPLSIRDSSSELLGFIEGPDFEQAIHNYDISDSYSAVDRVNLLFKPYTGVETYQQVLSFGDAEGIVKKVLNSVGKKE